MRVDWKEVIRDLIRLHHETGFAMVPLLPDAPAPVSEDGAEPITPDEDLLRVYGRRLTRKPVSRFLWKHRKQLPDPQSAFVWSRYYPRTRTTYVGLGRLTHG